MFKKKSREVPVLTTNLLQLELDEVTKLDIIMKLKLWFMCFAIGEKNTLTEVAF
jgi:hypothetical protein